MTEFYRVGTASINNAQTVVTGQLTGWLNQVEPGDMITFDNGGSYHEIASVASNTSLTLAVAYPNASVSSGAYAIVRLSRRWALASELAARTADLLDTIEGGAAAIPFTPWTTIAATNVQTAIQETTTDLTALINAKTAAQTPFTPSGSLSATNTQAAIEEVVSDLTPQINARALVGQTNSADIFTSPGFSFYVGDGITAGSTRLRFLHNGSAGFIDCGPGNLNIRNDSLSTRIHMTQTGALRLYNYGSGTLTTDSSGNVTASSDERLKEDIEPFTAGLTEILTLNPISYRWTEASGLDRDHRYSGLSAQNVQAAIPEAIGVDGQGFLTVQDRPIIAALINAVQELSARVEALEAEQ